MSQIRHLGGRVQQGGKSQIENASYGAHEVDHGVCLAAQGLWGHVRHQGHGRGTVEAPGDQEKPQSHHEGGQLEGGGFSGVAVVQHGQQVHQNHRPCGAGQNIRGPAAQPAAGPVGEPSEKRQ